MIIDKLLQVSHQQAVTNSAASTDVIDFGQGHPNTGMDDRSKMVITVTESATATGSATVKFAVQDSADNSSFTDVAVTAAVGKPISLLESRWLFHEHATAPLLPGVLHGGFGTADGRQVLGSDCDGSSAECGLPRQSAHRVTR